ncbi:ribosomal protein S20, partial [Trypanosoma rangeli]
MLCLLLLSFAPLCFAFSLPACVAPRRCDHERMAYVKKDQVPLQETQRVLVKMTSRNAKAVENVMAELLLHARNEKVELRGPLRLPTRKLRITTRKTPCGN